MPFMTDGRGADCDRRLVRHRPRAGHRPAVHARRADRHRRHAARLAPRVRTGGWCQPPVRERADRDQAARRSASPRRLSSARLVSRRAASEVDAEVLADLAEAVLLAVEEPEARRDRVAAALVEHAEQLIDQVVVGRRPARCPPGRLRRWRSCRRAWRRRRRRRSCRARRSRSDGAARRARRRAGRRRRRPGATANAGVPPRSPGMRIRLPFWSSARPIAWRIQNVAYVENLNRAASRTCRRRARARGCPPGSSRRDPCPGGSGYRRAMETTSRRLARMNRSLAAAARTPCA